MVNNHESGYFANMKHEQYCAYGIAKMGHLSPRILNGLLAINISLYDCLVSHLTLFANCTFSRRTNNIRYHASLF
jgi:hypothetical protein